MPASVLVIEGCIRISCTAPFSAIWKMPTALITLRSEPSETLFTTFTEESSVVFTAMVEEPPPSRCIASYAPYSCISTPISQCVAPMLSPLPSTTMKIAVLPSLETPNAVLGCLPFATMEFASVIFPSTHSLPPPPKAVSIPSRFTEELISNVIWSPTSNIYAALSR